MKMHVKTGDTVVLLTGKFKDKYKDEKKTLKTGKVLEVSPKEGKVIVGRHQHGNQTREAPTYGRAGRNRESGSSDLCL